MISTTFSSDKDIMNFGEDEQTEQMLQVLNSNKVRDKVIERFNLMEHYNIDPNQKFPYTKLNKLYDNRIKFRRTEYNAVKITVLILMQKWRPRWQTTSLKSSTAR